MDSKEKNEWILNKAGVKRELLDTVKATKLAHYGHTMRKQGNCLEKEIMQGTRPGACRRGRPRTAWIDNIKSWTGLFAEVSVRMTEDRDKWRKYVHGVASPRIEEGEGTGTVDISLKSSRQCAKVAAAASAVSEMIRRTLLRKDKELVLQLYKSLVRPRIEYCIQAWRPYLSKKASIR